MDKALKACKALVYNIVIRFSFTASFLSLFDNQNQNKGKKSF
jgi:hypothetical protein